MGTDAGPHATPDQVRAAQKRADAATQAAAAGATPDPEQSRTEQPKNRRAPKGETA